MDIQLSKGEELSGFRVRNCIGEGQRGSVWSAVDPLIGAKAVVKIVKMQLDDRASIEDELNKWHNNLAALRVKGITGVKNVGHLSGPFAYMIRDFAPGRSLRELSKDGVSVGEALDLISRACRIVSAAHQASIVHGNLSIDNIFVTPGGTGEGRLKLIITDLGSALLSGEKPSKLTDLRQLADAAHQLIYRRPLTTGLTRFDPLGDLLARGADENHPEAFTDILDFATELEALAEHYPKPEEGKRRITSQIETEAKPEEGVFINQHAKESFAELQPTKDEDRFSDLELPLSDSVLDEHVLPPQPNHKAKLFSPLRLSFGFAICVFSLTLTFRLILGYWPGAKPAPKAELATLELKTEPPGAKVMLDGKPLAQKTPLQVNILSGKSLKLAIHRDGYRLWTQTIALTADERRRQMEVTLIKNPTGWGSLKLSADVMADFFLDGRCVGTQTRLVTLGEVRAGVDHRLFIRAPGRQAIEQNIKVNAGKVSVLDFKMPSTPPKIATR